MNPTPHPFHHHYLKVTPNSTNPLLHFPKLHINPKSPDPKQPPQIPRRRIVHDREPFPPPRERRKRQRARRRRLRERRSRIHIPRLQPSDSRSDRISAVEGDRLFPVVSPKFTSSPQNRVRARVRVLLGIASLVIRSRVRVCVGLSARRGGRDGTRRSEPSVEAVLRVKDLGFHGSDGNNSM